MEDVTIPEDVSDIEWVLTVFGKEDAKLEGNIMDVNGENTILTSMKLAEASL
jgi:hypothetical protein